MNAMSLYRNSLAGLGGCLVALPGALSAGAQEVGKTPWLITPGQGIGQVKLGMSRQTLHTLLGAPTNTSRRKDALVIERWAGKKPSAKSAQLNFKTDFITVYLRDNRVVQVDASSPAFKMKNGLSTQNSAQDFQAKYRGAFQSTERQYHHNDPEGIPASKHFIRYEDNRKQGLAWRYGTWGNLAPEVDPASPLETISVHQPGRSLLLDPDGSDLFTTTSAASQKAGKIRP